MMSSRVWASAFILLAVAGCGSSIHPHVEALLDAPESFAIDVEGATGLGEVTGASVEGDSLVVGYAYPGPEGDRSGRLVGVLDGAEFVGTYDTRGPDTRFQGPVRLAFVADGSASGVWNDGEGTVALVRP